MKIAFYNLYDSLNKNNFMFENGNVDLGDNLLAPLVRLKEVARDMGIDIATVDVLPIEKADKIVFIDMPARKNPFFLKALKLQKELFLIAFESPLIRPESHDVENHKYFKKIFTWDDSFVKLDSFRYKKINFSHDLPKKINKGLDAKQKLCCMIAGNKKVLFPTELYSERIKAIRWFEANYPDDFDLFGIGWNEFQCGSNNRLVSFILRKCYFLRRVLAEKFPSYRGTLERKRPVLEKYKFSICYENIKETSGFITEKIFDCFFAGCIPVYWGANNVLDHIPGNCFLDKRKFDSYENLHDFMVNISDVDYSRYLNNIEDFLNSKKNRQFSIEYFVDTILSNVR